LGRGGQAETSAFIPLSPGPFPARGEGSQARAPAPGQQIAGKQQGERGHRCVPSTRAVFPVQVPCIQRLSPRGRGVGERGGKPRPRRSSPSPPAPPPPGGRGARLVLPRPVIKSPASGRVSGGMDVFLQRVRCFRCRRLASSPSPLAGEGLGRGGKPRPRRSSPSPPAPPPPGGRGARPALPRPGGGEPGPSSTARGVGSQALGFGATRRYRSLSCACGASLLRLRRPWEAAGGVRNRR